MDIDSCPSSDSRSESPILSLNNSGRILLNIPCKVCRDYSSGKHYGIFACDGCAGFFKRSIRRRRSYLCKARGSAANKCLVDKTHRNQCRACRLKRCIKEGMNKDAVQEERGPRNSTLRRQVALNMQNSTFAAAAAAYANLLPSGAFPGATTPYFTSTGGVGMTPAFGANPFSPSVSPMTSHPHFPSNHFSATLPTVPVSQSSGSLFQPYLPPLFQPPPSAQSSAASMIYPKDLEYFRSALPPTAAPQQPPPPSSFQTSSQNSSSPKTLKEEAPVPPNPPISKCSSPSTSTSYPLNTTSALSSHETLLSNYYKQLLCAKDQSQLSSLLFNLYQQRAAVLGGQHQHHHHRAFPHGPPPGSFYPSPYGHYPITFPDPPLAQSEAPSQPAPADVSPVSPKRKSRKSGPTDAPSLKSSLSSSSSSSASSSSSSSAPSSPNQSTPPELIPPPQLPPTNSAPLLVPTFPSTPSVSMHQPYASLMNAMIYSQASQLPPGGGLFPTSLDSKMRPLPEPAFFAQHLNWLHSLPPTFLPPPLPMSVPSVSKVTSPSKSSSNGALSEESQRSISA